MDNNILMKREKSSIARRLLFSYCVLIITFFLFGAYTLFEIGKISGLTRSIYDHPLVVSNAALQANVAIKKIHSTLKDIVLFQSTHQIQHSIALIEKQKKQTYHFLDIVRDNIIGAEGQGLEAETRMLFDIWHPIRKELIYFVKSGEIGTAANITIGRAANHVNALEDKILGLNNYARNKATTYINEFDKTASRLYLVSFIFLVSALVIASIIAFYSIYETSNTEKKLRKSEMRFRTLTSSAPVGIFEADSKGNGVYFNKAVLKITGLPLNKHLGSGWTEGIFSDDLKPITKLWEETINGKASFDSEFRFIDNNNLTWVASQAAPIKNEVGKITGFIGTFADITKLKVADNALKESEERFRELIENIDEIFWIRDAETNELLYISPNFENIWGMSTLQVKEDPFSFLELTHPDDREKVTQLYKNQTHNMRFELEYRIVKPDGSVRWIHGKNFPVLDDSGNVNRVAGVIRDITNKKEMEKELIQSHNMEAIGTLAGGIAHDFNNILSSIIGFTELSIDNVTPDSNIADNLQEIYTAGNRAKDLVWQILAFARQTEEEPKPIHVDSILKELIKFLRSTIPKTIEIKKYIKSNSAIMGNPTHIYQLVMNLCTNAAHAMDESGGILKVSLKDVSIGENQKFIRNDLKTGNYIQIKVSDTGVGIPSHIIGSIFEPYFTTKDVGEGTGMGLAVVYGVVESLGGNITVDSELGEGTTFKVYIPTVKISKEERIYHSEELPTGAERILFIDDELTITKMGARILESLGYLVTTRTSSLEALELFKQKSNDFDLVITDMTMPNMTGDMLAIELMKIRPEIPIIICTGYSKKISEETAFEIGIKAFANKPIVKIDLAKTVRKALDEAKSEKL